MYTVQWLWPLYVAGIYEATNNIGTKAPTGTTPHTAHVRLDCCRTALGHGVRGDIPAAAGLVGFVRCYV